MSSKENNTKKTVEEIDAKISEIILDGKAVSNKLTDQKMEVDYSEQTSKVIEESENMVNSAPDVIGSTVDDTILETALENLLNMEKQTRSSGDMHSTSRLLVTIVTLCYKRKQFALLNTQVSGLSKKRGQLKAAITKMVQKCMEWIKYPDENSENVISDLKTEVELINTLRSVTEGKIFVEVERARLTHRLSLITEKYGGFNINMESGGGEQEKPDVEKACKIMQELSVETYGSMDRKEKVEMILEQMRLCLTTEDYIRTQIISKKINVRFFDDVLTKLKDLKNPTEEDNKKLEEYTKLKLTYYRYMIHLNIHDSAYLNVCRHFRSVFQSNQSPSAIKLAIIFALLSPHSNEQSDMFFNLLADKVSLKALDDEDEMEGGEVVGVSSLTVFKGLLEEFTNDELIDASVFCQRYEVEIRKVASFPSSSSVEDYERSMVSYCGVGRDIFDMSSESGLKRWKDLKHRIVEYNIRMMAKYYTRINLSRMCQLVSMEDHPEQVEDFLCEMVSKGEVHAKTDRLLGVVDFQPPSEKEPKEILNQWSHNIESLMNLVQKTSHLINKEQMVHKHMVA